MTNTQTQPTNERPSDEVTGAVLATLHGLGKPPIIYEESNGLGQFVWLKPGRVQVVHTDPRTNPDASQRLLAHVLSQYKDGHADIQPGPTGWRVYDTETYDTLAVLPVSGEPFRHAVVRLAAQCLGVEG